jgi:hypothetical protein
MVDATDSAQKRLGRDAKRHFLTWRDQGRLLARSNASLMALVGGWAARDPGRAGYAWPRSVSVLELLYGVVHFMPELHDDSEGQVYLEVFTRQLTAMSLLSGFEGRPAHDSSNPGLGEASVRDLLCDWLGPVAEGTVDVDAALGVDLGPGAADGPHYLLELGEVVVGQDGAHHLGAQVLGDAGQGPVAHHLPGAPVQVPDLPGVQARVGTHHRAAHHRVDGEGHLLAGALDRFDLDPVADLFEVHAGLRRSGCCFAEVLPPADG